MMHISRWNVPHSGFTDSGRFKVEDWWKQNMQIQSGDHVAQIDCLCVMQMSAYLIR